MELVRSIPVPSCRMCGLLFRFELAASQAFPLQATTKCTTSNNASITQAFVCCQSSNQPYASTAFSTPWQAETLQHETPVNIPRLILKWCFQMFGMGIGVQGIEDFEPVHLQAWPTAKIILLSTWFAYTFVILNTISSQLPVMFAFDNPKQLPFNDVKGLLDSDFVVYGTSTAADMLKLSIGEHHTELSARVRHMPTAPPGENRYDHYNHIAKAEKSVLIINQETLLEMSFRNCEMFVAIDNLVETRVSALLMLKNSTLRESFERGYAKATQNGVAQFAIDNYEHYMRTKSRVRTHGQCYRRTVQTKPSARVRAIHIQQVYFLFGWLICSFSGCFGVFLSEYIVFLFEKKKCWFRLCRRLGIFTFTYTVNHSYLRLATMTLEKKERFEYRPFLSSGWFLSWMQLLGLLPYGTTSGTSVHLPTKVFRMPSCRTVITAIWSFLVLVFVVLYAAVDFQESFLEFYRSKLSDLEFFTLAIHSFRIFSNLLAAVLILIAFVRKRRSIPDFIQRVSLELAQSSTDMRKHHRLVHFLCCCIPLCVLLVCVGCTLTALQVVKALAEQPFTMDVPIYSWSTLKTVSEPFWMYLICLLSGPMVYMAIQTTVDFFLIICVCAIGFGFLKVNRDMEELKARYDQDEDSSRQFPKANTALSAATLCNLQALNLRHLILHECVEQFNGLFAVEVLLLTCRSMMAFLAVVAVVMNKTGRKENTKSPMYHMDKAIPYYVWSMGFVAITGAVMHISAFVWMSDKAEECLPILRSISVADDDKKVRVECAEFSRRVRKNPSAVSLLGLCSINRPYITAVFGAMLTFLVLIYQVQDSKKDLDALVDRTEIEAHIQRINDVLRNSTVSRFSL